MRGRIASDASVDRWARHDWWGPTIDSPDPLALARFYARLLDERTKTLLPDGHPFCLYAGE